MVPKVLLARKNRGEHEWLHDTSRGPALKRTAGRLGRLQSGETGGIGDGKGQKMHKDQIPHISHVSMFLRPAYQIAVCFDASSCFCPLLYAKPSLPGIDKTFVRHLQLRCISDVIPSMVLTIMRCSKGSSPTERPNTHILQVKHDQSQQLGASLCSSSSENNPEAKGESTAKNPRLAYEYNFPAPCKKWRLGWPTTDDDKDRAALHQSKRQPRNWGGNTASPYQKKHPPEFPET